MGATGSQIIKRHIAKWRFQLLFSAQLQVTNATLCLRERERVNATTKHEKPNTGICVFNALYFAHQPNRKFEWDPHASHPGPSTLALGRIIEKLWKQNKRKRKQMQRTESTKDNKSSAKHYFSKLASIALIGITSSMQYGCTTQAWYEGVKMNAQNSCANQPPAAYQDCRSRINNQQYDQYEKERAAVKNQ